MLSGFILTILTGTFVLLLPPFTTAGHISLIDALFTATSAVCVTGLTVLDTGTDFTLIGQVLILTMFQLGGIGIVFFSVLFAMVFMGRAGVGQKSMFSALMTPYAALDAWGVFRTIVSFTLAVELLGALFLFVPMLSVTDGDFPRGLQVYIQKADSRTHGLDGALLGPQNDFVNLTLRRCKTPSHRKSARDVRCVVFRRLGSGIHNQQIPFPHLIAVVVVVQGFTVYRQDGGE